MSSTISWHIEKHTSGDVGGLQIHNQRLTDHHSNKRIDISKSHENLHAKSIRTKFGDMSYSERINQEIENRYLGKRKIRSNAIVDVEHTIQFGGDVFEKLSRDQKNNLMMSASQFVAEKFGGWENVIDWNAHLDETNDHAHMDMMPLTEDGRLSAKDLYSKGTLQIVQNELLTHMQELYPEMDFKRADKAERGFANGKTQKDYERLKTLSDANKDDLKQVEALKHEMAASIRDIEPEFKVKDNDYEQAFIHKGEMSDDVFYAKYGYQPEPVKSATGFDQVKDFLSLKRLKTVFLDAWQRFKRKLDDLYQNKDSELKQRENALKEKTDSLSTRSTYLSEKGIKLADKAAELDEREQYLEAKSETLSNARSELHDLKLQISDRQSALEQREHALKKIDKYVNEAGVAMNVEADLPAGSKRPRLSPGYVLIPEEAWQKQVRSAALVSLSMKVWRELPKLKPQYEHEAQDYYERIATDKEKAELKRKIDVSETNANEYRNLYQRAVSDNIDYENGIIELANTGKVSVDQLKRISWPNEFEKQVLYPKQPFEDDEPEIGHGRSI
jgi:hypothetical protein